LRNKISREKSQNKKAGRLFHFAGDFETNFAGRRRGKNDQKFTVSFFWTFFLK
jgi:hypothetical protein